MHGYKRSQRLSWMSGSICFDVVFCFLAVAIISILAYTGVPSNCSGLSKTVPGMALYSRPTQALADKTSAISVSQADALDLGSRGFNTTGDSNMQGQNRGTLDQYCGMERAFYFISLCIM